MTERDLLRVVAIETVCYATPWTETHFRSELSAPHSRPHVAVIDGAVVGYLCLFSLFEEAQVLNVAVDPSLLQKR